MNPASREQAIGQVLEAVTGLSRALTAPRSTPFGDIVLTRTQLDILFLLARADQPLTPGALADALRVTPGAISQTLEHLRTASLVHQSTSAHDGRVRMLQLTDTARAQVDVFERAAVERMAPWFDELSDAQLREVAAVMSRVAAPNDRAPVPASPR